MEPLWADDEVEARCQALKDERAVRAVRQFRCGSSCSRTPSALSFPPSSSRLLQPQGAAGAEAACEALERVAL